jgi:hypothetical protein
MYTLTVLEVEEEGAEVAVGFAVEEVTLDCEAVGETAITLLSVGVTADEVTITVELATTAELVTTIAVEEATGGITVGLGVMTVAVAF